MDNFSSAINWFDHLNEWIPDKLPGEKVHLELSPMRALSSEAIKTAKNVRESAVAVHVFEKENDLQIVLTQRNTYDGAHSGQVSFPGGKKEARDENLLFTARRESFEEIGLPMQAGTLIGSLTDIYIPVSNFSVKPYVIYHEREIEGLSPDPREVESIFFLPRKVLIDKNTLTKRNIHIQAGFTLNDVPCFIYGNYVIWGATAILLNELKHILIADF
ncbi:MAG: CoA pyrophosphatase [Crocinitomicaceae bacterium]